MPSFAGWVPLRWFAGPLDSPATPHETWLKPETLTLLKGTPINCLVVNWSAGRPEDSAQQQALRTLIERAKADKLAIVGRVTSTASGAKAAGLDAIIADAAKVDGDEGLPIIPTSVAGAVPKGTSLICATKALWPRIPGSWRTQEDRAERTEAGPTGAPWVDSNGWLAMTVAAKAPDTRLWLMPDLPKTVASLRTEQYELAVADAAAYGARWVLTFDPDFRARLGKRETEALESFKKISKAVEALRTVPAAQAKQQTKLLIASNFEGAADKLAGEMVNLVGRRHLQAQVARVDTLTSPAPDNITTLLLIVDRDPPSSLHKYIESFTSRGGLVIGPASLAHFAPREATGNFDQRFDLYTMG
ncbi:MAG TPA: hypothetical protein VE621_10735 [Bryobacteraceae bacterium]|nr:hypothetical protein [Bryobacteraceae bacterium]